MTDWAELIVPFGARGSLYLTGVRSPHHHRQIMGRFHRLLAAYLVNFEF
jgi:hypothetical protein